MDAPSILDRALVQRRADPNPSAPSRVTVDPEAVARNFVRLAALTPAECAAVVKADAYGHGIAAVGPALVRAGCRTFCVALLSEALTLRPLAPDATIYVLNGMFGDPAPARDNKLVPFLSSVEAIAEWPHDLPFALNVDTGMNRLGVTPNEAAQLHRRPVLVASHFACADEPGHPLNDRQAAAFAAARARFPDVPASLANSAALLTRDEHYDLVRPGIALYGVAPVHGTAGLEPTVKVEARVIQVRTVLAGETVGYGAAATMSRPSRIAIVSAGYADGLLRAAGGSDAWQGAPAFVNGADVRVAGRVSMDLIAVDVTDCACARGDLIELIGPHVPADVVAVHAGTIAYELFTGLSRRAERVVGSL